jgi:hypothetical protein
MGDAMMACNDALKAWGTTYPHLKDVIICSPTPRCPSP